MEVDEQATLASLRRQRDAMAALIERHEGRVVNTWGDAVIAEFGSVVEAVHCATEIQQELSSYDLDRPHDQRIRFRIGINLGDVMVEGADIYGDGINVAARLQELAEPGGILISGPVYDQVYNKLPIAFEYLGGQQVKNLTAPVLSYRVTLGVSQDGSVPPSTKHPSHSERVNLVRHSAPHGVGGLWEWFVRLPRPIALLLLLAVFLLAVNLFSGTEEIWFHWPGLIIGTIVLAWAVLRRKSR